MEKDNRFSLFDKLSSWINPTKKAKLPKGVQIVGRMPAIPKNTSKEERARIIAQRNALQRLNERAWAHAENKPSLLKSTGNKKLDEARRKRFHSDGEMFKQVMATMPSLMFGTLPAGTFYSGAPLNIGKATFTAPILEGLARGAASGMTSSAILNNGTPSASEVAVSTIAGPFSGMINPVLVVNGIRNRSKAYSAKQRHYDEDHAPYLQDYTDQKYLQSLQDPYSDSTKPKIPLYNTHPGALDNPYTEGRRVKEILLDTPNILLESMPLKGMLRITKTIAENSSERL